MGADSLWMSVAEKKGTKMTAKWSPTKRAVWSEPFPLLRVLSWNGPQAVKGAPLLGAAKRTLDGEDPLYTKANFRPLAHGPGSEMLAVQRSGCNREAVSYCDRLRPDDDFLDQQTNNP